MNVGDIVKFRKLRNVAAIGIIVKVWKQHRLPCYYSIVWSPVLSSYWDTCSADDVEDIT